MSAATITKPLDEYRLPLDVEPTHYDVTIRTDLEKLTFDGFVKIDLDIKKETTTIVFNSVDLELSDASIYSEALKTQQVQSSRSFDEKMQRVLVHFPTALPAGSKAQLQMGFQGKLTSDMRGYYKSGWECEGQTKYYSLTQFESTDARRAFPCWDEPLLKATYAVTMISRANTVNLGNMPVVSEKEYERDTQGTADSTMSSLTQWFSSLTTEDKASTEKWKITKFETTPRMSTYIVAWANGPFEYLESSYTSPLSGKTRPLRIYATSDVIHQAQLALDVKRKVLPLYEKVFDVEYPLPKLDTLVAHDFDAGAMENWGLITGRTSAFLLDPKRADMAAMKRVVTVQSHEVAHMWFGNITTMKWWDNLYLNEGFATMMGEVIIADKVYPDWKLDTEFITEHLNDALKLDAKLSSHPIEVECPDANKIDQIFDALSYSKAASVLRMLSDFVGEERFLKGVSIYLKKHLFANSVTKNLWEGIGEATGVDVPKIMDNWISKMGFPVLTVTESPDGITVRQDRFLETGLAAPEENETIWTIPLSLLSVDKDGKVSIDKTAILDSREKTFPVDTSKPFKLNAGTSGVYRVLYTPERLASIAEEAAKGDAVFSLKDRVGLVHDVYALSRAGLSRVSSALTFVDILKDEKEYLVWDATTEILGAIAGTWWEHAEVTESMDSFRRALYKPLVERLGWEYLESDSADTKLLRTRAIHASSLAKNPEVLKELKERFDHYMRTGDNSRIPADLQRSAFICAVKYGGQEEYDFMKKLVDNPPTPSTKTAAIAALGATQDAKLVDDVLEYTMTKARDQDVIYFFSGLIANYKYRRTVIDFFKANYDTIYRRFANNSNMRYLVSTVFSGLSTKEDLQKTEEFFSDKDTSKYFLSLAQTQDTVKAKIAWLERSTGDLSEWLANWEKRSKL